MSTPRRSLPTLKKVSETLTESIPESVRRRSVLNHVHVALRVAFEKAGFEFDLRHRGDAKIALWRLPLTRGLAKKRNKRRFVFVPGFGDTPLSWLPVLAPLNAVLAFQYDELVCLDFPGFGGALAEEPAFESMDELKQMFAEVMETLKPHTLMGHSLGGWLTSDYVADLPADAQPAKLILADPSGMVGDAVARELWKKRFEDAATEGWGVLRPHVFGKEPFWFKWLANEFTGFINRPEIQNFVKSFREEHLVEQRAKNIRSEVSLIWGEIDTLTPTEWIHVWKKELGEAGVPHHAYLIRKAGHSIQIEKPAATLAVITQIILGKKAPSLISNRFWTEVTSQVPSAEAAVREGREP